MKIIILLLFAFLLSACDGSPSKRSENPFHLPPQGFVGDSVKGELLFQQNCQICHGKKGRGTNQGPPLVDNIYNSSHHANLAFNLAVKNGVRSHHWRFGDMKPIPDVSPIMIGHITQYVRKLQRQAGIR